MTLAVEDIERIAEATAERVVRHLRAQPPARYVDAATLAALLDVERDWIYRHADQLGGVRLAGRHGRLRFDLQTLAQRLAPARPPLPARPPTPRRRQTAQPASRPDNGAVRLLPYLVESPAAQHRSGRAAQQRRPGQTPGGTPDA